jgi:aspartyl-tRNA(Asn)/glutamyl-tRNA(Gln) amidotransferase subunit A
MQDSIGAMAAGVRSGRTRARDVVDAYVDRLVRTEGAVHAYLAVLADEAARRAEQIDRLPLSERSRLPLAGVPIALKDNIVWTDGPTTAGSRILENFRSPYAATAAVRLSDAGAIIIGKTNLDEFAMGSSTEHSAYGPTHNPWDLKRVPGGSSGGSAAAVAVGSAAAALGSDTGGSIRQPAAYCGVVGLKPTYGRVSRYGLVAFASSLDQIGPLTRHVEDAARLLQVMAGYDARDLTSLAAPVPDWTAALGQGVKSLTVGVVEEYLEGLDAPVAQAMERAERILREAGAKVARVHLPNSRYGLPAYYVMANAEASSNLARYDGVRYGLRVAADGLYQQYDETRRTGFGAEVQRRIMLGTFALSATGPLGPFRFPTRPVLPDKGPVGTGYAGKLVRFGPRDSRFLCFILERDGQFVGELSDPLPIEQDAENLRALPVPAPGRSAAPPSERSRMTTP